MSLATLPSNFTMHDKSNPSCQGQQQVSSNVSRLKNMFQPDDFLTGMRRSPDTKRKRGGPDVDGRPNKQRSSPDLQAALDPSLADPQKFYETTNHVQRFQLTRSLFEKMEQQNVPAAGRRSKSPASSRTMSPSPARSPVSPVPRLTSPDIDSRYRAGSVENIIDEQTYNRKYRNQPQSTMQDLSRSESDLTRERSGSDTVVTASIQHPKSLIEQYESKTSHSSAPQRSYSRSPSREQEEPSYLGTSNVTTSKVQSISTTASSEPHKSQYNQTSTGAVRREKSPETSTSSSRRISTETDSDIVERWRNRYNRDKHSAVAAPATASAATSLDSSNNSIGSSGALLWKRRSQEESGISKEEIEASLANADKYFSRMAGGGETSEVLDSRMTDSTYSSGSGEEMARSESGHELTATTPDSPTTPTNDYNWTTNKYGMKDTSGFNSKPTMSPKPDLPPRPPQSQPPSYSDSMGQTNFPDIIQDDLDADYVDISAATPNRKMPPTPTDSLSKKKGTPPSVYVPEDEVKEEEDEPVQRREDGDGHESKQDGQEELVGGAQVVNQIWDQYFNFSMMHHTRYEPVDGKVHMLQDGNFFYEVQGLPEVDPDADMFPSAHKASKIKFNTGPIKVFSTYSVEEYDRKNEDVDPMAASAEYELEKRVERMELFEVELNKGSDGLGLSIIGMGVGADAGLEKLGIFIKTLTEGGAAQKDGAIHVNDQIIEVDGKSLVGVTQAYAASVLRNTSGKVKFLIGREKDPSKSEVARLIQQSLEQDRRRAEQRKQLEDQILHSPPEQPVRQVPPLPASPPPMSPPKSPTEGDLLDASEEDIMDNPMEEEEELQSPTNAAIEVFDLPDESSSEAVTPDMDSQVLFIKLKEAQYKNAVSEAELAKLKAKMILLENAESQKKHYEKKCEDMAGRLREAEKSLQIAQKQLGGYQDALEASEGKNQHHAEKMIQDYATLEKKYNKAKKLIKEYQNREKELLDERESRLQQQAEKEQQYNQLCKSMKDRIFQLEKELSEALKAAGLPPAFPLDSHPKELIIPAQSAPPQKIKPVVENLSEISGSESDSPDNSPDKEGHQTSRPSGKHTSTSSQQQQHFINGRSKQQQQQQELSSSSLSSLNAVPHTPLLDTSASKNKAYLVANSKGSMASRRPPSRKNSVDGFSPPNGDEDEDDEEEEPFFTHDSDSTIKKGLSMSASLAAVPSYAPPPPPSSPPPESDEDDQSTSSSRYAVKRASFPSSTLGKTTGTSGNTGSSYLYAKYQHGLSPTGTSVNLRSEQQEFQFQAPKQSADQLVDDKLKGKKENEREGKEKWGEAEDNHQKKEFFKCQKLEANGSSEFQKIHEALAKENVDVMKDMEAAERKELEKKLDKEAKEREKSVIEDQAAFSETAEFIKQRTSEEKQHHNELKDKTDQCKLVEKDREKQEDKARGVKEDEVEAMQRQGQLVEERQNLPSLKDEADSCKIESSASARSENNDEKAKEDGERKAQLQKSMRDMQQQKQIATKEQLKTQEDAEKETEKAKPKGEKQESESQQLHKYAIAGQAQISKETQRKERDAKARLAMTDKERKALEKQEEKERKMHEKQEAKQKKEREKQVERERKERGKLEAKARKEKDKAGKASLKMKRSSKDAQLQHSEAPGTLAENVKKEVEERDKQIAIEEKDRFKVQQETLKQAEKDRKEWEKERKDGHKQEEKERKELEMQGAVIKKNGEEELHCDEYDEADDSKIESRYMNEEELEREKTLKREAKERINAQKEKEKQQEKERKETETEMEEETKKNKNLKSRASSSDQEYLQEYENVDDMMVHLQASPQQHSDKHEELQREREQELQILKIKKDLLTEDQNQEQQQILQQQEQQQRGQQQLAYHQQLQKQREGQLRILQEQEEPLTEIQLKQRDQLLQLQEQYFHQLRQFQFRQQQKQVAIMQQPQQHYQQTPHTPQSGPPKKDSDSSLETDTTLGSDEDTSDIKKEDQQKQQATERSREKVLEKEARERLKAQKGQQQRDEEARFAKKKHKAKRKSKDTDSSSRMSYDPGHASASAGLENSDLIPTRIDDENADGSSGGVVLVSRTSLRQSGSSFGSDISEHSTDHKKKTKKQTKMKQEIKAQQNFEERERILEREAKERIKAQKDKEAKEKEGPGIENEKEIQCSGNASGSIANPTKQEAEKQEKERIAKAEAKEKTRQQKDIAKNKGKKLAETSVAMASTSTSITSLSKKENEKARKAREKQEKADAKEREKKAKAEAKEQAAREKAEKKAREKQEKEAKKAASKEKKRKSVGGESTSSGTSIASSTLTKAESKSKYANQSTTDMRSSSSGLTRSVGPDEDIWNPLHEAEEQPVHTVAVTAMTTSNRDHAEDQEDIWNPTDYETVSTTQTTTCPVSKEVAVAGKYVIEQQKQHITMHVVENENNNAVPPLLTFSMHTLALSDSDDMEEYVLKEIERSAMEAKPQQLTVDGDNFWKEGGICLLDSSFRKKQYVEDENVKEDEQEIYSESDWDDQSDASSLSHTSYDPGQASLLGGSTDLIPTSMDAEVSSGGIMLLSSKPRNTDALRSYGSAPTISSTGSSSGGIQLKAMRPLHAEGNGGGIQLLSSRSLDTGYGRPKITANHLSETSSSTNIADYEHGGSSQSYDIASATLTITDNEVLPSTAQCPVPAWSNQQVSHWLSALNLSTYVPLFHEAKIDGRELLTMDNNKLRALGVTNSKDRDLIRKKVKDLKVAMERERKQRDKEQKARDKLEKQAAAASKKKKAVGSGGGLFGK